MAAQQPVRVSAGGWAKRVKEENLATCLKIPATVQVFKVEKSGPTEVDILPFIAGAGNPRADVGVAHFERTYWRHGNVGPQEALVICPAKTFNERCPICEESARLRRDPKADQELIKDLRPKERQIFMVIDATDAKAGPKLWDIAPFNFGELLVERIDSGDGSYDLFADLAEGLRLRVVFKEESSGRGKFQKASIIDFKPRAKPYSPALLAKIPCPDGMLVKIPYDKLAKMFYGGNTPPGASGGGGTEWDGGGTDPAAGTAEEFGGGDAAAAAAGDDWETTEAPAEPAPKAPPRKPAAAAAAAAPAAPVYDVGAKVIHADFGECTVERVKKNGLLTLLDANEDTQDNVEAGDVKPAKAAAKAPAAAGKKSTPKPAPAPAAAAAPADDAGGDDWDQGWDDTAAQ